MRYTNRRILYFTLLYRGILNNGMLLITRENARGGLAVVAQKLPVASEPVARSLGTALQRAPASLRPAAAATGLRWVRPCNVGRLLSPAICSLVVEPVARRPLVPVVRGRWRRLSVRPSVCPTQSSLMASLVRPSPTKLIAVTVCWLAACRVCRALDLGKWSKTHFWHSVVR